MTRRRSRRTNNPQTTNNNQISSIEDVLDENSNSIGLKDNSDNFAKKISFKEINTMDLSKDGSYLIDTNYSADDHNVVKIKKVLLMVNSEAGAGFANIRSYIDKLYMEKGDEHQKSSHTHGGTIDLLGKDYSVISLGTDLSDDNLNADKLLRVALLKKTNTTEFNKIPDEYIEEAMSYFYKNFKLFTLNHEIAHISNFHHDFDRLDDKTYSEEDVDKMREMHSDLMAIMQMVKGVIPDNERSLFINGAYLNRFAYEELENGNFDRTHHTAPAIKILGQTYNDMNSELKSMSLQEMDDFARLIAKIAVDDINKKNHSELEKNSENSANSAFKQGDLTASLESNRSDPRSYKGTPLGLSAKSINFGKS